MTTDNPTPVPSDPQAAATLSAKEFEAFKAFTNGEDVSWDMQETLIAKGYLKAVDIADNAPTELGKRALAEAAPAAVTFRDLSADQLKYLTVLNQGGTFEDRNLPVLAFFEHEHLLRENLIVSKGTNGICYYWAITSDGKRTLAEAAPAEGGKDATITEPNDYRLIWDALTPEMQKELIEINDPAEPVRDVAEILLKRNMAYMDDDNLYEIKLTKYGKQVLAAGIDNRDPATSDPQAVTLSESELAALKAASEGKILPKAMRKRLWDLSLVGHDDSTGEPYLTIAGRALLAEAAPAPTRCANCGMSITASASPLCTDCAIAKMASDPEIQREMTAPTAAAEAGSLCDWCGAKPAVHNGECEDCWRLPGHEGRNAEPLYVMQLRAHLQETRDQLTAARDREQRLLVALGGVINEARRIQDDWAGVTRLYAPEWTHPYKDIDDIAQEAIAAALSATGSEVTK